jgi:hypothetical protein
MPVSIVAGYVRRRLFSFGVLHSPPSPCRRWLATPSDVPLISGRKKPLTFASEWDLASLVNQRLVNESPRAASNPFAQCVAPLIGRALVFAAVEFHAS